MEIKATIMVVEDEKSIRSLITAALESQAYRVIEVENGREAMTLAPSHCPDLILLDLGLPDIEGMEVLKSVREWSLLPVIVVSARQHEDEKVAALDCGADDYVTKPFNNKELLARIRTALRRSAVLRKKEGAGAMQFSVGDLQIDYDRRRVTMQGKQVHLTPIEYKILTLLSANAGRVLTHAFVLKEVWGPYVDDHQLLRVNMANIRRKLEKEPADPRYIQTEIGVGYRMVEAGEG